ncbi:MAG TPA: YncE family protein [Rhizomicrobium sp.]|nr:YncE family protein [Rhizomicrobium sp.]
MRQLTSTTVAVLAILCFAPLASHAADNGAPAYKLAGSVALGGPERWDFVYFDAMSKRVYVSHRTHVDVVDVTQGKVVGQVTGIGESHGVVTVPSLGRGYADDTAAKVVVVFDLKTLARIATVPVGIDADAMAYDPATDRVFVMNADGHSVSAIDARADRVLQTVPLGGAPEAAAADGHGKLFINIASTNEIVAFDTMKLSITARWPVPACEKPHGMAMDEALGRIFVSCVNARMLVLDSQSGKTLADLPIGKGTDSAAFYPARKLAFSSNGDGTLSIIAERGANTFENAGGLKTPMGARTMALDPDTGRIFLVAADADPSAQGKPRAYVANSTKLLIFELH